MINKYIICASILAPTFAWAQSSVTMYGVLDVGLTYANNQRGHSNLFMDSGIVQANRWGLLGIEDLGGGTKALFNLENGFSLNNGALGQGGAEFGRTAAVGLSNERLGKVTLGRQYDFFFDMLAPDSAAGAFGGANAAHAFDIDRLAGEQLDNTVKYLSPTIDGLTAGALYGFSNAVGHFDGTMGSPRSTSYGLSYARGPLNINFAYVKTSGRGDAISETLLEATTIRSYGIGARYVYNALTLFGNYTNNRISGMAQNAANTMQVFEGGANWLATPAVSFGAAYTFTKWPVANFNQISAGAHYFLSKRTDVYLTAYYEHSNSSVQTAEIWLLNSNASGPSSTRNQLAVRLGMRTHF